MESALKWRIWTSLLQYLHLGWFWDSIVTLESSRITELNFEPILLFFCFHHDQIVITPSPWLKKILKFHDPRIHQKDTFELLHHDNSRVSMWLMRWKILLQNMKASPPRMVYFDPGPPISIRSPHFFPKNRGPPRKYGVLKNQVPP